MAAAEETRSTPDDGGDGGGDDDKLERIQALATDFKAKHYSRVPEISVDQLLELQQSETSRVVLVDCRLEEEQQVSMIPGAISAKDFESRMDSYKDYTIVPYCTIGFRSGLYARHLIAKHKLERVSNLEGSILAWTHHKLPLEHEGRKTTHVHVFSKDWMLQASGYDAVFYERVPAWRMLGFVWSSFWARRDP